MYIRNAYSALIVSSKEPESTQFVLSKYIFAFIIDSIKYHRRASVASFANYKSTDGFAIAELLRTIEDY